MRVHQVRARKGFKSAARADPGPANAALALADSATVCGAMERFLIRCARQEAPWGSQGFWKEARVRERMPPNISMRNYLALPTIQGAGNGVLPQVTPSTSVGRSHGRLVTGAFCVLHLAAATTRLIVLLRAGLVLVQKRLGCQHLGCVVSSSIALVLAALDDFG